MPGKGVLTSGLLRLTDNNIVQAAGKYPSLLCFINFNGSTLKIGEVVSTIPSEQVTTAIILGFAEADRKNSLAIGFNVETVQVSFIVLLVCMSLAYIARTLVSIKISSSKCGI